MYRLVFIFLKPNNVPNIPPAKASDPPIHDNPPCQLFRNDGDLGFVDVALSAGVTNDRFTKGVSWGDYNNKVSPARGLGRTMNVSESKIKTHIAYMKANPYLDPKNNAPMIRKSSRDPSAWARSVNIGTRGGDFSFFVSGLDPLTKYFYRTFASNAGGAVWSSKTEQFETTDSNVSEIVINEIHYDVPDKTVRAEFIELYNPTDSAIDLGK